MFNFYGLPGSFASFETLTDADVNAALNSGGGLSVQDATIDTLTVADATFTDQILAADGVQAAPGIAFAGAHGTGLWRNPANGYLVFVVAGVIAAYFGTDNTMTITDAVNIYDLRLYATPPANAGSTGILGQIAVDDSYIYVCTATNTWKRVQLEQWPLWVELPASGNVTVTKEMHGVTFIDTAKTGAVTLALPTDAPVGTRYRMVCNSTDLHPTWFKVSGGVTVRHGANTSTDGPYLQNLVGNSFEIEYIATGKWFIIQAEGDVLDASSGNPF